MSKEHPGEEDLIVLRHGELFLKGGNRHRFEQVLQNNVQRVLADLGKARLAGGQGRLFVSCDPVEVPRAASRLGRVFGIASLSPATSTTPELSALTAAALARVGAHLERHEPRSFRVSCRRSDKQFPHNSMEVNTLVGRQIQEQTGLAVNLDHPDLDVGVEIGTVRTFVFTDRINGAGGLPVGVSGRVALLLSGGIDSPVAGSLMQKRGCVLHPIYFHSPPYTGGRTLDKVERLAGALRRSQRRLSLSVVPFTAVQLAIRDHCPADLAVVLYRRLMMRIASRLARQHDCEALATGENLGQVASQTLTNMAVIELVADLPILRPLLTYDKTETIALARRLGTYDVSIEPYDDCCSLFVPKHPVTRCRDRVARRAEASLDIEALVEAAVSEAEDRIIE